MGLVAQPLEVVQHRVFRLQAQRLFALAEETLAPGVAIRSFGNADHRQIVDAEIGEHAQRRRELTLPAIDQHQIGPGAAIAVGIFLDGAGEAPGQHLAHHAEIVARRDLHGFDVEFAIGGFDEAFRPGDDHRADRVRALDVAVVVDLDAVGRRIEAEDIGDAL